MSCGNATALIVAPKKKRGVERKKSPYFWKGETWEEIAPQFWADPDIGIRKEPIFKEGTHLIFEPTEFKYSLVYARRRQRITKEIADYLESQKPWVLRENFRKWFGDSKVVDAEGKPLVVYHGTNSEFTVFNGGRGGFYFTNDKKAANEYSKWAEGESEPRVISVYLSIKNPLVLDRAWYEENVNAGGEPAWEVVDNTIYETEEKGHDGLILLGFPDFDGVVNGSRLERAYDQYIAFRPEQIKSATGNNGDFDPGNPDITK